MPMRRVHAEHPSKTPDFATGSNLGPTTTSSTRIQTRAARSCASGGSCMSSYVLTRMRLVNPAHRAEGAAAADLPARPQRFPLGPEAARLIVNPASSLAPGPFGTINAAHKHIPALYSPPSIAATSSQLRRPRLDPGAGSASTMVSRWPPWPCSSRSQRRRSRYLPFKPRPSSRDSHRPSRRWPRGLLRSACARGPFGVYRRAFLKRATAFDTLVGTRCRTAVPAIA